jgi:hypothetical protein
MDLQTISSRTGIPSRTLRYVMDHKMVPTIRVKILDNEVGRPRVFADDYGVAIACAALLLQAGVRRETVENCLRILAALNTNPSSPAKGISIATILQQKPESAIVDFGDGVTGRLRIPDTTVDTGWMSIEPLARLDKSYCPKVTISIDVGQLVTQILASPE